MLGQLLGGRYKIVQNLGTGSFGHTYIAVDLKLFDAKCVVKQLKPLACDLKTLKIAKRLFDSEAELLHRLGTHDQIPHLQAHFQENQEFYLVQQLIDGHPLSSELAPQQRLSEAYVIDLLQGILEPLVFVHQHNVVHRDLKPSNIIRRLSDGKIVLIDFGAIKQIGTGYLSTQETTHVTVIVGTPGYMPSEQASGSPKLSSDIYAVGMIGIQALTGLKPQQLQKDEHTAEILWRHLVQVSPELADVLDKMTRYDFRERYHSAIEALQVVQQLAFSKSQNIPINITDYPSHQQATQQQILEPTLQQLETLDSSLPSKKNSIVLFGLSLGAITSVVVAGLIYIFFNSIIFLIDQQTQSPSQNALPRTNMPTPRILLKHLTL
ncbi:serine/threonine protein kinase [Calothrix sp. HK-06]|nr:serine/threonine protein kinase [Calothrix sp. HK-06]